MIKMDKWAKRELYRKNAAKQAGRKKRGRPKKEPTPVEVPPVEETLPEVAEESETSE